MVVLRLKKRSLSRPDVRVNLPSRNDRSRIISSSSDSPPFRVRSSLATAAMGPLRGGDSSRRRGWAPGLRGSSALAASHDPGEEQREVEAAAGQRAGAEGAAGDPELDAGG